MSVEYYMNLLIILFIGRYNIKDFNILKPCWRVFGINIIKNVELA